VSIQDRITISEIFKSVQGEGFWVGSPSVFIRVTGCNLDCAWCDTAYAKQGGESLSISSILAKVNSFGIGENIVITGGEPTAVEERLMLKLVVGLKSLRPMRIQVETNGYIRPPWLKFVDWVTVSPKRGFYTSHNPYASEIKLVYDGHAKTELEEFEKEAIEEKMYDRLFLQPKSNDVKEIDKCLEIVKERKLWRLSLQTHRLLKIR